MTETITRSRPIRVAVVDDHAVVREGIARIVDSAPDLTLASACATGDEFLATLAATPVDVCVLDLMMDGATGLEVLARMHDVAPDVATLVLTIHTEDSYGVQCIKAGASGFLTKGAAPSEIADAIRQVHEGRLFVAPSLASRLAGDGADTNAPHVGLSNREFEVFVRIAAGRRNAEISRELGLDQRTVSSYRRRVLVKLGVERDAEIVRYAIAHGILGPGDAAGPTTQA